MNKRTFKAVCLGILLGMAILVSLALITPETVDRATAWTWRGRHTHTVGITSTGEDYLTSATITNLIATNGVLGALNGVIGGTTPAAGTFTTLIITSFGAGWTNAGRTIADLGIVTTVDINGGTADAIVVGGASPAAGTFTTLTNTGARILTNSDVSLTSPTKTFSVTGKELITLNSNANQTGHYPTGGTLRQVITIISGAGSNTMQFDDGTSMTIGANVILTEAQNDVLTLICISADGDEWAAISEHQN